MTGVPDATNLYLDGVQPFVQYRRLLSLALLVRSLTDNPLLPTELFATPHRHYTGNIDISLRQAETLLSNLEAGLVNTAGPHADVSGLGMGPGPGPAGNKHHHQNHNHYHQSQKNLPNQAALVSANTNANTHMNSLDHSSFPVLDLAHTQLSWTIKFEMCRRKLVARKLQTVVRAFLNHSSVVIPR